MSTETEQCRDLITRLRSRMTVLTNDDTSRVFIPVPLIDADSMAYKIAWKNPDDLKTAKEELDRQVDEIKAKCHDLVSKYGDHESTYDIKDPKQVRVSDPILFLSDSKTFRHKIAPSYKEGRSKQKEKMPMDMIQALKTYMSRDYGAVREQWLEADDLVLYYHYNMPHQLRDNKILLPIVVSNDKDVLGVHPDLKIDPTKDHQNDDLRYWALEFEIDRGEEGELAVRNECFILDPLAQSIAFPYYQVVTGDGADNISGIPNIGEKKFINALKMNMNLDEWMDNDGPGRGLIDPMEQSLGISLGNEYVLKDILKLLKGEDGIHFDPITGPNRVDTTIDTAFRLTAENIYIIHYGPVDYMKYFIQALRMVKMLRTPMDMETELNKDIREKIDMDIELMSNKRLKDT